MFYTSAWCTTDETAFRELVPLELLGASLKRYGSKMRFQVVMLEGFAQLSPHYRGRLQALGIDVLDFGESFQTILGEFPAIERHYSRFERNCLLRWLAFQRLRRETGATGQFWHLDSDVVLHTSLEEIARETAGQTFMLQGCPVLVSVADERWFELYLKELGRLEHDIAGYSNTASKRLAHCRQNDVRLCNQSLYRNPIGSDQDLLEYLISAEILPQEPASGIFGARFYYVQNPLQLTQWDAFQGDGNQGVRATDNRELWVGDRQIPFIHYQTDFSGYADIYLRFRRLGLHRSRLAALLLGIGGNPARQREPLRAKLLRLAVGTLGCRSPRDDVIEQLTESALGTDMPLVELLNFIRNP